MCIFIHTNDCTTIVVVVAAAVFRFLCDCAQLTIVRSSEPHLVCCQQKQQQQQQQHHQMNTHTMKKKKKWKSKDFMHANLVDF